MQDMYGCKYTYSLYNITFSIFLIKYVQNLRKANKIVAPSPFADILYIYLRGGVSLCLCGTAPCNYLSVQHNIQ